MSTPNQDVVQKMLLQMRNSFLEDIPDRLYRLEVLLLGMEERGVDADSFNEFYRIIHSLKGSGGTFGLHIITTICHQLEDILNLTGDSKKESPQLLTVGQQFIDLLHLAVTQIKAGLQDFPEIKNRLNELRSQVSSKQFMVLVVDNSKLSTQLYLQAIAGLPVHPVLVTDGYQALERALNEPFDLLITTNEIPVLRGVALIGALKLSESSSRHIKAILVTSNKEVSVKVSRSTDADYTIFKDSKLLQNLHEKTMLALALGGV